MNADSATPTGPTMTSNPKSIVSSPVSLFRQLKWEHMLGGVAGGVVSTLVLHPLDLVKIRFQVNEGVSTAAAGVSRPEYRGVVQAFRSIYRADGFPGLYRGVNPNVLGAGASWGLYFLFYNAVKTHMQDGDSSRALDANKHLLAASAAGTLTLTLTNPIWVTKTRLCLQYEGSGGAAGQYRGMWDCLSRVYAEGGIRGLYKGYIPGMFGVSHGAIQFMTYEELKNRYNKYKSRPADFKLGSLEYIAFAAVSKVLAATTTYPYQVVRSRLQDQHRQYGGVRDVIRQIWRLEGMRGLYKGMVPYLLHVTPNICIVFLLYEHIIGTWPVRRGLLGFDAPDPLDSSVITGQTLSGLVAGQGDLFSHDLGGVDS